MSFKSKTSAFIGLAGLRDLVSDSLAIAMGAASTIIYAKGRGVVVDEPSLIAINTISGEVLAIGQEAQKIKVTDLEKIISESRGPLIVNFWATFCKPCMEEIPYFQKMQVKYEKDGLQVLFVSLDLQDDYPKKVNAFIKKRKMSTYFLDETNADYFCPRVDEKWSGVIPATLFINNGKNYRKFLEEQISEDVFENEIQELLGRTN